MENAKAIVTAFFKDISALGLQEAVHLHGTSDFTWWICGLGDVTHQLAPFSEAFKRIFDDRGMVINPIRMVSEGDQVAVEAVTDSKLIDGGEYKNTASYWLLLRGSKILEFREYFDSDYGHKAIGPALGAVLASLG